MHNFRYITTRTKLCCSISYKTTVESLLFFTLLSHVADPAKQTNKKLKPKLVIYDSEYRIYEKHVKAARKVVSVGTLQDGGMCRCSMLNSEAV